MKDNRPQETSGPARGRWFIPATVFLVALVLLALFVIFTGGDNDKPSQPPTGSAPTAPAAPGCGELPDGDDQVPVDAPPADWVLLGTVAAPTNPTVGPAAGGPDGLPHCYAATPTGALFAAANFMAAVADPALIGPAIDKLTAPGPGATLLAEQLVADPVAVTGTGARYQISGFTFTSYTDDQAALIVTIDATGGQAAVPLALTRADDEWLVQVPDDGNLTARAYPIKSLAGYTPWAGA